MTEGLGCELGCRGWWATDWLAFFCCDGPSGLSGLSRNMSRGGRWTDRGRGQRLGTAEEDHTGDREEDGRGWDLTG